MSKVQVSNLLLRAQDEIVRNAAILDRISQGQRATSRAITSRNSSSLSSAQPISKHLFTSIFRQLHTNEDDRPYVYIENQQPDHFLYGLVVPLLARILAVSTPGLLCIVELPRRDNREQGGMGSGNDSEVEQRQHRHYRSSSPVTDSDEGDKSPLKERNCPSNGSRHSFGNDGSTLHLLCNGFEVLTGKMPKSSRNVGDYTLNTVGWSQAGIVSPDKKNDGVLMRFSNKLAILTEGVVVTYANGSMVQLTVHDPVQTLNSLSIDEKTPVVIFRFKKDEYSHFDRNKDQHLYSQNVKLAQHHDNCRKRELFKKWNMFMVEIGNARRTILAAPALQSSEEKQSSTESLKAVGERGSSSDSDGGGRNGNASGSASDTVESVPDRDASADEGYFGLPPPRQMVQMLPVTPLTAEAVPNAVPLFVNTLNAQGKRHRNETDVSVGGKHGRDTSESEGDSIKHGHRAKRRRHHCTCSKSGSEGGNAVGQSIPRDYGSHEKGARHPQAAAQEYRSWGPQYYPVTPDSSYYAYTQHPPKVHHSSLAHYQHPVYPPSMRTQSLQGLPQGCTVYQPYTSIAYVGPNAGGFTPRQQEVPVQQASGTFTNHAAIPEVRTESRRYSESGEKEGHDSGALEALMHLKNSGGH